MIGWALFLLLLAALPAQAHNGSVAIAAPIEGIVIDGDFSDWPEGMETESINRFTRDLPQDTDGASVRDFRGAFRVGYNGAENVLYIAVRIEGESVLVLPIRRSCLRARAAIAMT